MALVYSCCFWFSLRLGGILIATFSIAILMLIICCLAHSQEQMVKDAMLTLINTMNLIYIRTYVEKFQSDPQKYISLAITFSCIYMLFCFLYAYGAYMFNNILMTGYILSELLRLLFLAFCITTWLLVLKENTMDIGIHIGTSVAGTFFLLGLFYLWICASNLPILINEMERDQQAATITKLQKMLQKSGSNDTHDFQGNTGSLETDVNINRKPFTIIPKLQRSNIFKTKFSDVPQNPIPYYLTDFNRYN